MPTTRTRHRRWPILAGATLLAFAAHAQQGQAWQDPATGLDADGDGRISAQEHAAAATARFTRMDVDRDGQLTPSEMASHRATMRVAPRGAAGAMRKGAGMMMPGMAAPGMHAPGTGMQMKMQMYDSNSDGVITAGEHAAAAKAAFDRIDASRDGRITAAEWAASHPMMGAATPGMGAGVRGMPMAGPGRLAAVDTDGNGSVSMDEHAHHAATMFGSMDADSDGYLAGEEITRHRALMMSGWQGTSPRNDAPDAPAKDD